MNSPRPAFCKGDGLTVLDEYRGYLLDGGADFTGTGPAANPSAFATFNKTQAMQEVAKFYCHPTRGAGIDLYWVNRPFVPLTGPAIDYGTNGTGRADAYRYTGQMFYQQPPAVVCSNEVDGSTWIIADNKYSKHLNNKPVYEEIFPPEGGVHKLLLGANRDLSLSSFTLLLFLSRQSFVLNNGSVRPAPPPSCLTYLDGDDFASQGSFVFAVMVSEEAPFTYSESHYTTGQFQEHLWWSTAHELGHLILGGYHAPMGTGSLMSSRSFLSTCVVSTEELFLIDLKTRKGVTP